MYSYAMIMPRTTGNEILLAILVVLFGAPAVA